MTVSAITTFLTPYLIKSADGLVTWFDRAAPTRLVNYLALYTQWTANWREAGLQSMASKFIRRWSWQIVLNLILVAGVFILCAFVARKPPNWLQLSLEGALKPSLWLCAMLVSLPLLIATYRKLQALGMLIGEVSTERLDGDQRGTAAQAIIANTVLAAGIAGVGLYLLVLSSTVLPSGKELVLLSLIVLGVAFLMRRAFTRIYSKAQIALEETFSQPAPSRHPEPVVPALGPLQEVQTWRLPITVSSSAAGKLIRQLALRSQTGASVIVIDRAGVPIINPGPDEEILPGDELLLLGSQKQLEGARRFFGSQNAVEAGRSIA